ncbi:MAG TPA: hypothetical protein VMW69_10255 [Spirochaetia bacterium]|nr:hypothetical protein [Spirochaetia bacterium]
MRKFFVSLIILIIAGGVAFYFGWIQLQLPADTYGVIFTKTGGFEQQVVKPGTFVWRWQRLLPTNLTLYTFKLQPQQAKVFSEGTLPSGALYSQYLDGKPDFSYKISISLSYLLNPDSLPGLMMQESVTPKTLDSWYSDFSKRCIANAQEFISAQSASGDIVTGGLAALQEALLKHLQQDYPEVRFTSVTPETLQLPDVALYLKAKQQYLAIVDAEQQGRQQAAVTKTNLDQLASQRIDMLRRFGELFNQYPVLLKYFDLDPAKRQNIIPGFGPGQ